MSNSYENLPEEYFNSEMLRKLRALLLANVGAQTVTVDGQTVAYADLEKRLDYFERRYARQSGTRPPVFQVDLGGY